jgi:uncharacterized protein (DUF2062 family)
VRAFWSRRVAQPVMALLRQGLTPEGIAFAFACGVGVGLFPVIGATTLLGIALGAALGLNQPALQLANWLAYPLQLLMIVPLVRLGEWLAGAPHVTFSVTQVVASMSQDPAGALGRFGVTGLHGILGWAAIVPIVVLILYRALLPVLHATQGRLRPSGRDRSVAARGGSLTSEAP